MAAVARVTGAALAPPFWGSKLCICGKMRLCGILAACEDAEAVREEKGPGLVDGIAVCSHSRKGASGCRTHGLRGENRAGTWES